MWLIAKRLKKRYMLKVLCHSVPKRGLFIRLWLVFQDDVRQSLYDDANELVRAVKKRKTPFLGGKEPHLGDLAAYGAMCSFEGCRAFDVSRQSEQR